MQPWRGSSLPGRQRRGVLLALALCLPVSCALAQSADRERAQMMQLQQQMQRLQQELSATKSRSAKDVEALKQQQDEAAGVRRQLLRSRAEAGARAQEIETLHAELERSGQSLASAQADIERLKKEVAMRDEALAMAAQRQREGEQAQALLGGRLKQQTARSDLCEVKHAQAMSVAASTLDAYEKDRLRMCEPFTGIWRLHHEEAVQSLRERLYESRLDVPLAKSEKAEPAPDAR